MFIIDAGSTVFGFMAGLIALAYFAYFVRELHAGRVVKDAPAIALTILGGTSLASAPIGHYALGASLWPRYCMGEGIPFIPAAFFVVYRYALARPPARRSR